MVKAKGKYLLATGSNTDWPTVLSNWDLPFARLNTSIYDISGLPLQNDVSLNRNANFTKIDISANAPQLSPFRAYMVDISGLILYNTKFYMDASDNSKIYDIYVDDILGKTSYDTDICANQINAVTMAQAVTSIAEQAFSGLPELTRVNISKTVTTVGNQAFYDCSNLSTLTFEADSLISIIGISAFQNCSSLSSITIPKSLTILGNYAFQDCSGLSTVTFEADSSLNIIGFSSFKNTILEQITIPKSVTELWDSVFQYCSNLSNVTFDASSNLTAIGGSAFQNCTSLPDIVIPKLVEIIRQRVFQDCSQLSNVTFDVSSNLTAIEASAFQNCTSLSGIVIPKLVETIGQSAFQDCSSLSNVTFDVSSNLTAIGDNVFHSCNSLSGIVIPKLVETIGQSAFQNCSGLSNLTFDVSSNLTTIGELAFQNCTSLSDIVIPKSVVSIGEKVFENINNCTIQFESSSNFTQITNQFNGMGSGNTINIPNSVENSVTDISYQAFSKNNIGTGLSVIFENDSPITSISNQIFYQSYITKFNVPQNVATIEESAFQESTLESINISQSVVRIGKNVFYDCSNLEQVIFDVDSKHTHIGESAYNGCTSLKKLYLPPSIEDISSNAFVGSGLEQVYMSEGALSVLNTNTGAGLIFGTNKFFGKDNVQIIDDTIITPIRIQGVNNGTVFDISNSDISGNLTKDDINSMLNSYSISDITSVTSVTIGNRITGINGESFQNCSGLTEIFIPSSVSTIGADAFKNCTDLSNVYMSQLTLDDLNEDGADLSFNSTLDFFGTVNSSVTIHKTRFYTGDDTLAGAVNVLGGATVAVVQVYTVIGTYAFWNAKTLSKVFLSDSITTIGTHAFRICTNLLSVEPKHNHSLQVIGEGAFNGCTNLLSVEFIDNPSIQFIGATAFSNCTSLSTITIPKQISTLKYTFQGCTELKTVTFENNSLLTDIGDYVFHACSKLNTITLPDGLKTIGTAVFYDCTSLSTITLPDGLTTIGSAAFYNCTSLSTITLPNSLTGTIGEYAFAGSGLTSINMSNTSVTTINRYAFSYCTSLSTITLPDSLTGIIGESAFVRSGLVSINMSNTSVTTINRYALSYCTSLSTITLPNSLTGTIGEYAFAGSGVTSINMSNTSVTIIDKFAFSECSQLTTLYFSVPLQRIEEYAFFNCNNIRSPTNSAIIMWRYCKYVGRGAFQSNWNNTYIKAFWFYSYYWGESPSSLVLCQNWNYGRNIDYLGVRLNIFRLLYAYSSPNPVADASLIYASGYDRFFKWSNGNSWNFRMDPVTRTNDPS